MMNDDVNAISREEFLAYEDIRRSGVTNMWDVTYVSEVTGIPHDKVLIMMAHYGELAKKYLGELATEEV